MPFLKYLFVLLFSLSCFQSLTHAQDSTAAVHFVYGSDTSTPGINVRDKSSLYHDRGFELFASPTGNAAKVMNESYRDQFKDSFGEPLKMTWWMQGASLYRFAENTNLPFGSTMSLYLMQKYHGDKVEVLGDEMTFHYHTWVWSDINGDGKYWWNQAFNFSETQEDFDIALAEHFLEENMFPVSFRSGWHYMDNEWQQHLNKWIPFSLHNDSPTHTNPTVEPIDNLIDWGHSTTDFVPFRPSESDYQVGGGKGGWNTRSRYFLGLSESDVRQIFEQAQQGFPQVAAIWGHLAENQFLENMEKSLELIYTVSEDYPDVPFHFSTAIEAMQDWLQTSDQEPPNLSVQTTEAENGFHIEVSTDEPIFQKVPFLAVKSIYEQHRIVEMQQVGELRWKTIDPIDEKITAKWGVAVTDSVGNLSKNIFNILPDDIYIDNSESSFTTNGSNWTEYDFNTVSHIWERTFSQTILNISDSASVQWSTLAPSNHQQQVFIRFPDVADLVNSVTISIWLGGSQVNEITLNDIIPNKWIFVDLITPEENQQIDIHAMAKGMDKQVVFAADVVKLSPLIKERQLKLPLTNFDFGSLVYNKPHLTTIPVSNLGSTELVINEFSTSQNIISVEQEFPVTVPAYGTVEIELNLFSDIAQFVSDTITFHSNDPLNPIFKKGYQVEFRNYFEITDNEDEENYEEIGNWYTSSTQAYGNSSRYAVINSTENAFAVFKFSVVEPGYYDVAYIVPGTENAADRADYTVLINGEEMYKTQVNQNSGSGSWISLEMMQFESGDEIKVIVKATDQDQPNKVLRADAVRLSLIGENIGEVVLDNGTGYYIEEGDWETSVTQAYGETSRFTTSTDASATYSYRTEKTSPYHISIIIPESENSSQEAQYSIYRNNVLRGSVVLNQNHLSGQWRSLGSWSFFSGDTLSIKLINLEKNNPGMVLRADAIKLQYATEKVTSIRSNELPDAYSLVQNYPNPFNPQTIITYSIPEDAHVSLTIFDTLGRKVATLVNEKKPAGHYQVTFKADNLSSGIYFYHLSTENFASAKKMMLIK